MLIDYSEKKTLMPKVPLKKKEGEGGTIKHKTQCKLVLTFIYIFINILFFKKERKKSVKGRMGDHTAAIGGSQDWGLWHRPRL